MRKKSDRIIVDTNLWVSFLISDDYKSLDEKIKNGSLKIIFSLELIEEILTVLHRPKFKKYFSKKEIEHLIDLFDVYGELVEVKSDVRGCNDPKDNFLLSLAKDSAADYLLTGDKDLLEIEEIFETKIITYTEYLRLN